MVHSRDGDPGSAVVVAGGTDKTCRNICSLGYEGVEGHGGKDVNECVLWCDHAAGFRGIGHNDVALIFSLADAVS